MVVKESIIGVQDYLSGVRKAGKAIGFVPTMGALHEGHIELVKKSVAENDITGCSIFVNPIQFNNPDDLLKYPRTLEKDIEMLEEAGCNLMFVPSVKEMYPEQVSKVYDFGNLDKVMEGAHRRGHFNGVAVVVKKLFDIFQPHRAYFGEKDFQQLRIIQALVRMEQIPVEIIPCPTVREPDGLAMSSRNRRLSAEERTLAPEIYRTLLRAKEFSGKMPVADLKELCRKNLEEKGFIPDYFEIANAETLQPINNWQEAPTAVACVAAFLGPVRLIDNMILFRNFAG